MLSQAAISLALLLVVQVVSAFKPAPAPFFWLNTYLQKKSIGRYEPDPLPIGFIPAGPCPSPNDRCAINLAELPQSVKDIGVALPSPFPPVITLGQAVPQGVLDIWVTEVSDVELADLRVGGTSISTARESIDISVQQVKLGLKTRLRFYNLIIPNQGSTLNTIDVIVTVTKAQQSVGTNVTLSTFLDAPQGQTFNTALPRNISLNTCNVQLDLGLSIQLISGFPFQGVTNGVANFVIGIVQPLLGFIVCNQIIEQAFLNVRGQPGIVRVLLDDLFKAVGNLTTLPNPVISTEENKLVQVLTPEQKSAKVFSLRNSSLASSLSQVLDEFLGQGSPPKVNNVVSLLTNPVDGQLVLSNLQQWGVSVRVPTPLFFVNIDLINATLTGLNTFKAGGFDLLKNLTRDFTFGNRLRIGTLGVAFTANIKLEDHIANGNNGAWIWDRGIGSPTSASFLLDYKLEIDDIDLEAWISAIVDLSQLMDLQLGQLLGKSGGELTAFQQLIDAGKCASPALYGFALPFVELALGAVRVPSFRMSPNDPGITALVNNVTDMGLRILASGIRSNSADIVQHWLRPIVNSILRDLFVSGGVRAECLPYSTTPAPIYPNFLTSTLFGTFSQVIRDVVGGNPVPNNSVSVNELIKIIINILIKTFKFPGTNPSPGEWLFQPDFRAFPGRSFVGDQPSLRRSQIVLGYVKFTGLSSVSKLLIERLPGVSNGLDIDFAMGNVGLELSSRWTADYKVVPDFPFRADFVDESFTVTVGLTGLAIRAKPVFNYDLNILYQFTVKEVSNLWCFLAPLLSGDLDISISVADVNVGVVHQGIAPAGPVDNELRTALVVLSGETYPNLENMVNYILKSVGNYARRFLTFTLPGLENLNAETCLTLPFPFDTVAARIVSRVLTSNFTDITIRGLGAQPPPLTPAQADAEVFVPIFGSPWDLMDSFFVPLVNDAVTRVSQPDFRRFMQTLGNSTAKDILSKMFTTDLSDGSVGLDANLTDILGATGFPLDFAIDNATLLFRHLKLSKLTNLRFDNIRVIKPVGKFVTETYLSFPGTMKFSIAFALRFPRNFKNPADPGNQFLVEEFQFDLDVTDLIFDLQLVTAVDIKRLTQLTIGNLVEIDPDTLEFKINWNFIDCFFGLFFQNGLKISRLLISLKTNRPALVVSPNTIVSQGVEQTLQAMLRQIFDFYILDFPDITQGFVRSFINDFILLPNVNQPNICKRAVVPNLPPSRRIFNFLTNPTVNLFNKFVEKVLAGDDGSYSLFNTVLETAFQATTFFRYNPALPKQTLAFQNLALVYKKERLGFFNASVTDIKIRGGGTFRELNLVRPRSNVTFYNDVQLRGPSSLEFVLRYSVDKLFKTPVEDELKFKISVTNVTLAALVTLELSIPELLVVPLGGLTNISQIACALTAIEKLRFNDTLLLFEDLGVDVSCVGVCTSPLLEPLKSGGTLSSAKFDSLESILGFVPGLLALVSSAIEGSGFQSWLSNALANAQNDCRLALNLTPLVTVINAPGNTEFSVSIICALAIAGIVAGCALLAPLGIPRHFHLKTQLLASHLRAANEEPNATSQSVARYMAKMEREAIALAWHPAVPLAVKLIVPITAVVNIFFLFLSFLVFAAFSVDVELFFLGNQSQLVPLIPLTVGLLIDNLWNSGAFILAIGLVILSGVWPIVKNLILLSMFYAPKWFVRADRRRFILHVLDVLGKYSFIEGFVVVIVAGGIRFNIILSEVPLLRAVSLNAELFKVNILVTIDGGMVILCVAAMATLALNHLVIWYHEKAAFADRRLFKLIDGKEDLVLTPRSETKARSIDYVFSTQYVMRPHDRRLSVAGQLTAAPHPNAPHDRFDPLVQNGVIFLTGAIMLFMLVGQCTPFFTFEYAGVGGIALSLLIEGGNTKTYSLMNLGIQVQQLSDGTALTNFKLFFFQLLWYLAIIVAPHLQLALHLVVWMVPLTLKSANRVFFFAKVAGYWASVEIFAIAVIAIIIEIDRVVAYLIDFVLGGSCSAGQPYLTDLLGSEYNGVCLRTTARVEYGFYIAWFAMMGQIFMGIVMIRANQIVLRDREDRLEERPHAMWSWIEYIVLRFMFAYGAEHHRPYLNPTSTIIDRTFFLAITWLEDPQQTTKEFTRDAGEVAKEKTKGCCSYMCSCFRGVDSVSLEQPVGHAAPSKWQPAPSQSLNPHQHVVSGAGKWNAPPQPSNAVPPASSKWNVPPPAKAPASSSKYNAAPPSLAMRPGNESVRSEAQMSQTSFKVPSSRSSAPRVLKGLRPAPAPPAKTTTSPPPGLEKGVVVRQPDNESSNPVFKREKAFSVDV